MLFRCMAAETLSGLELHVAPFALEHAVLWFHFSELLILGLGYTEFLRVDGLNGSRLMIGLPIVAYFA